MFGGGPTKYFSLSYLKVVAGAKSYFIQGLLQGLAGVQLSLHILPPLVARSTLQR